MHGLCVVAALALAAWLAGQRRPGPATRPAAAALALTAGWALAAAMLGTAEPATGALLALANLAWLATLHRLFAHDERDKNVVPVRLVILALAFVALLMLALAGAQQLFADVAAAALVVRQFAALLGVLFSVGALVLVHNLYAGAAQQTRQTLRWPAAALATMWLYDLTLATVIYLRPAAWTALADLRGAAMLPVMAMLAFGLLRHSTAKPFGPSRSFAFQSVSLLVIGAYVLVTVLVSQALAYAQSELAAFVQVGFLALAGAAAIAVLPSRRVRGWLQVTLTKHLFKHRYDYRAEWLRFTATIGRAGHGAAPLRERIVQAIADITDSPSGLLLTPHEDGGLALAARWQWPGIDVPAEAINTAGARFFEESQFIIDLDDLRRERADGIPAAAYPAWLLEAPDAWAMVPLRHFERLVGLVVLALPAAARRLDWEDFDVLRVVGRQLASYLAEQASQDALGEAQRFDEFNRRIAFVMHDIKNLASQLTLLARNAEKHADNPAFRADMLLTLRNSADKLQALLDRLGRYGHQSVQPHPVKTTDVLATIARHFVARPELVAIERMPTTVLADREALEQALVHLVQNALEAGEPGSPVFLDVRDEGPWAIFEVIDSGCGMSPEFVRTRLFKPFHSAKPDGFGIGAFEARELVRAMGGRLDVESREGLGTRFSLRLPLADAAAIMNGLHASRNEVA
ncbi:MAG: hypothetical protein B7Z33_12360 [Sphingomonadales bacterium 12-68-11]|nr:MAG: hypothetical protein B7Z33_12360 [Sphingomonadales bacterium 12-68-11]